MGGRIKSYLNLSRRPFLNTRPVTRVALVLWLLGGLLLLGNVTLFWNYLSGSTEKREELVRLEEQVEHEREAVSRLDARLAGLDLEEQNEQVEFLNAKIAERSFSWSLLFDRLTETMPDGVRLIQLKPTAIGGEDQPGARRAAGTTRAPRAPLASDRVYLSIEAVAKTDEDMLRFVDNLFAHTAFDDPDITGETRDEEAQDRVKFSVRVMYLPRNATPGVTVEESPVVEPVVEEGEQTPPAETPAAEDETDESETE
ncbi:MAG TPA: hypothetical protein VN493_12730 [Thermoanaerobaculia bacterium]|nr:hypothetical protein [Thermoanaerobaculia bacterium]